MLVEVGIVIALYVLARLTPARWRIPSLVITALAAIVALVTAVDLGYRIVADLKRPAETAESGETPASKDSTERVDPAPTTKATVTRADGGSIATNLGYGIAVAKDSSLRREWIAVHDPGFPADLADTPGITTVYNSERYSGEYRYRSKFTLQTHAPLRAIRVVFLIFDVWGNHVRSLEYTEVTDLDKDGTKEIQGEWQVFSENEVEEHYASIGYVADVRLADGTVRKANTDVVLEEARRFSAKFEASDLDPEKPKESGTQTET